MNKLQKTGQTDLAFSQEQIDVIKSSIAVGASDDELKLFLYQAQRTGLDPLSRQIYFMKTLQSVKQKDGSWKKEPKVTIMSSIDGFRAAAQKTGEYEGQTEVEWCGIDGIWIKVWLKDEPPAAARVGVYRKGFKEPLYAVARFKSYAKYYNEKLSGVWANMPDLMIAKVAEALALRKAFPQDLSGLYTSDEMAHVDEDKSQTNNSAQAEAPKSAKKTDDVVEGEIVNETAKPQEVAPFSIDKDSNGDVTTADDMTDVAEDAFGQEVDEERESTCTCSDKDSPNKRYHSKACPMFQPPQ